MPDAPFLKIHAVKFSISLIFTLTYHAKCIILMKLVQIGMLVTPLFLPTTLLPSNWLKYSGTLDITKRQVKEKCARSLSRGFLLSAYTTYFKGEGKVLVWTQLPIRPEVTPVSLAWSDKECFYSPLDGMLVHHRVTTSSKFARIHLYSWLDWEALQE